MNPFIQDQFKFDMGGIYLDKWSCTKCDFKDTIVSAPFKVEPMNNVPKAKIEFRYCHDCETITRCFTGNGGEYTIMDIDESQFWSLPFSLAWSSIQELENKICELKEKRKRNIFFLLTKDHSLLRNLVALKKKCVQKTRESEAFYTQLKPRARCLSCHTHNIGHVVWSDDFHSCGGTFIKEDLGRRGSAFEYTVLRYDETGYSVKITT